MAFTWCNIDYIKFWRYTPAEIEGMCKAAQKKYKYEHAWLNAMIFNSQGPKDPDTKPPIAWQISDFLDENENKPATEEDKLAALDKECLQWKIWADNCKKGA